MTETDNSLFDVNSYS